MKKDKNFFHGHSRLAEERAKFWDTQQEAADYFGVSRVTWGQCERGNGTPSGDVLAGLALCGADVLYILTGVHAATHALLGKLRTASEAANAIPGSGTDKAQAAEAMFNQMQSALPADEQMWLDCYREWATDVKKRELRRAMAIAATVPADSAAPSTAGTDYQVSAGHGTAKVKGTDSAGRETSANTGKGSVTTATVSKSFFGMAIGKAGRKKTE